MGIRITEIQPAIDGDNLGVARVDFTPSKTLKVEGTLHLKDAELLERICKEVSTQTDRPLIVEMSDICSLDHASAAVLCRMKRQMGIEIKGMNLFTKKVIELTDEVDGCGSESNIPI